MFVLVLTNPLSLHGVISNKEVFMFLLALIKLSLGVGELLISRASGKYEIGKPSPLLNQIVKNW